MIRLDTISIRLGSFELNDISFQIDRGSYGLLMGRTGSGKTSILEAVCGLKPVQKGRIYLGDRDVTRFKPASRGIGFVPQDGALFTTMRVRDQLGFALKIRRWNKADAEERVLALAKSLGIDGLLDRFPTHLSGGELQRVALGRALSFKPEVLCMDEPLSALDDSTKDEMCSLLKRIQQETGVTILHITHSLSEARRLADVLFQIKDHAVVRME